MRQSNRCSECLQSWPFCHYNIWLEPNQFSLCLTNTIDCWRVQQWYSTVHVFCITVLFLNCDITRTTFMYEESTKDNFLFSGKPSSPGIIISDICNCLRNLVPTLTCWNFSSEMVACLYKAGKWMQLFAWKRVRVLLKKAICQKWKRGYLSVTFKSVMNGIAIFFWTEKQYNCQTFHYFRLIRLLALFRIKMTFFSQLFIAWLIKNISLKNEKNKNFFV